MTNDKPAEMPAYTVDINKSIEKAFQDALVDGKSSVIMITGESLLRYQKLEEENKALKLKHSSTPFIDTDTYLYERDILIKGWNEEVTKLKSNVTALEAKLRVATEALEFYQHGRHLNSYDDVEEIKDPPWGNKHVHGKVARQAIAAIQPARKEGENE